MTNATLKTKLGKVTADIEAKTKKVNELKTAIITLVAEQTALAAKIAEVFDPATLGAGDEVRFEAGKPKAEKVGLIVGLKDGQAKVAVGSGFDAALFTIKLDAIVGVVKKAGA